jgi:hypothetical protein
MFGNIICPGMTASVTLFPAWLTTELKKIYGSSILGLWVGEDLVVNGSNQVTSWPGRVGPTLTPLTAQLFPQTTLNGRKAIATPTTQVDICDLRATFGSAATSFFAVASFTSNTSTHRFLFDSYNNSEGVIYAPINSTTWYTATGWSHYADGNATETVPTSGVHVIEGVKSTSTKIGAAFGHSAAGGNHWPGSRAFGMTLSTIPSAEQRALGVQILRGYYSL